MVVAFCLATVRYHAEFSVWILYLTIITVAFRCSRMRSCVKPLAERSSATRLPRSLSTRWASCFRGILVRLDRLASVKHVVIASRYVPCAA